MIARVLAARLVLSSAMALPLSLGILPRAEAASEVAVVVNKQPITSYQIQQRAAFMKLRNSPGGAAAATDELIDETVKAQEIRRRGIAIPDAAVDEAFARFARDNRMTEPQLAEILSRAGFSQKGFKDYIRVQMGWGQAVQANLRTQERLSEQDVVQRMLQQGGNKPTTTEYTLQQVILVVPEKERSSALNRRMNEANAMRQRFTSCPATFETAKGLRDVTVRDLGRVPAPELPPRWKGEIENARRGSTTKAMQTERGVEYIAVCDTRTVSDDQTAALVFQSQDMEALGKQEPDKALLKTLRDKATVVRR